MEQDREEHQVFIVDWDIPSKPAWRRVYFYKKLRKVRKAFGLEGRMSTMSVLIVQDEKLAWAVHNLASQYGRSNIYRGVPLNSSV